MRSGSAAGPARSETRGRCVRGTTASARCGAQPLIQKLRDHPHHTAASQRQQHPEPAYSRGGTLAAKASAGRAKESRVMTYAAAGAEIGNRRAPHTRDGIDQGGGKLCSH